MVGTPLSSEPLSRVATHQLTFQQLYAELESALQLDSESKLAVIGDRAQLGARVIPQGDSAGLLYTGQGRYRHDTNFLHRVSRQLLLDHRLTLRSPGKKFPHGRKFDTLSISGCINRDGKHLLNDCSLPLNASRAAARKMEYYAKKTATKPIVVHHVLADPCEQLDCTGEDDMKEAAEDNNISIFEGQDLPCVEVESDQEDDLPPPGTDTNHVYVTIQACSILSLDVSLGICIDSAAQNSVIGLLQSQAYCSLLDIQFQPSTCKARNLFSFGTHKHPGLGIMNMRVPISPSHFLHHAMYVLDTNVPFLLGLDNMERYKMVIDTDKCVLSSRL